MDPLNLDHESKLQQPKWSSTFKNPRIVRVSRAFGGKDRHSKVCTVKGLRDRRIRLSVPTAVQVYHLQDRLGLNQPSKVIDWLLNATKEEINGLPPLPIPNFAIRAQIPDQGFGNENLFNNNAQYCQWNAAAAAAIPNLSLSSSDLYFCQSGGPSVMVESNPFLATTLNLINSSFQMQNGNSKTQQD